MEDDEYEFGALLDEEEAAVVNALTPEDITAIDDALLGATSSNWSKVAMVLAKQMMARPGVPDDAKGRFRTAATELGAVAPAHIEFDIDRRLRRPPSITCFSLTFPSKAMCLLSPPWRAVATVGRPRRSDRCLRICGACR